MYHRWGVAVAVAVAAVLASACGDGGATKVTSELPAAGSRLVVRGDKVQLHDASGHTRASLDVEDLPGRLYFDDLFRVEWDGSGRAWVQTMPARPGEQYIYPLRVSAERIAPAGDRFPGADPALSPDGRHLAYVAPYRADETGAVVVRGVTDGTEKKVPMPAHPLRPAFSPDGHYFAVPIDRYPGRDTIAVINVPSASVEEVTPPSPAGDATPTEVAWLGDRLVVNMACCGDVPYENSVVDIRSGDVVFTPKVMCAPSERGYGSGTSMVTELIPSPCPIARLRVDRFDPAALLLIADRKLYRWDGTSQRLLADGIFDVA